MHIKACFHASLRWDKKAKFESNDFYDINHACAALAYCDVFFTDKFVSRIANAKHTALTQLNPCHVTASLEEAITIVHDFLEATRVDLGCKTRN
jgi:hypothetical protein